MDVPNRRDPTADEENAAAAHNGMRTHEAGNVRLALRHAFVEDFRLHVAGWILDASDPAQPASLPVYASGREIGTIAPDAHGDAEIAGLGPPGALAFSGVFPVSERDVAGGIALRVAGAGADIAIRPTLRVPMRTVPLPPPVDAPKTDDTIIGRVGSASAAHVSGWAFCERTRSAEGLELVLFLDDTPVMTARCSLPRKDAAEKHGAIGPVGFRFVLPPNLRIADALRYEVRPTVGRNRIEGSTGVIPAPPGEWMVAEALPRPEPPPRPDVASGGATLSIVIVASEGDEALRGLLASARDSGDLARAEWIVVDPAGRDGSAALCSAYEAAGHPVLRVAHDGDFSRGAAKNTGASVAGGDIIVFVDSDIRIDQPIVEQVGDRFADPHTGVLGVGILGRLAGSDTPHPLVLHDGVFLRPSSEGHLLAPFVARGTPDMPETGTGLEARMAVTAAFLAVRRADFAALDGFDERYEDGLEDVDLCLRMRTQLGKAVLIDRRLHVHHEPPGGRRADADTAARPLRDSRRFDARWGRRLRTMVRSEPLARRAFWFGRRPVVAIAAEDRDAASDLGKSIKGVGNVHVVCLGPDAWGDLTGIDLVVVLSPAFDIGGAEAVNPYLSVLDRRGASPDREAPSAAAPAFATPRDSSSDGVMRMAEEILGQASRPPGLRIAIKCPAPTKVRDAWGDYHFAKSLARTLRRDGAEVRIDLREDWDCAATDADDVVIAIRGILPYKPQANTFNIMWLISHPDAVPAAEIDAYDHVYVASERDAARLAERARTSVSFLPQCADIERFVFDPAVIGSRADRILFVGNSRNVFRDSVRWSIEAGLDVHVFGQGWEPFIAERYLKGHNVPNEVLGELYAASGMVLCDHWADMARLGYVSNRAFDVLAVGGRLVTDPVEGIERLLPEGSYEVFRNAADLARIAGAPASATIEQRRAWAEWVREYHSFEARAKEILRLVDARLPPAPA